MTTLPPHCHPRTWLTVLTLERACLMVDFICALRSTSPPGSPGGRRAHPRPLAARPALRDGYGHYFEGSAVATGGRSIPGERVPPPAISRTL